MVEPPFLQKLAWGAQIFSAPGTLFVLCFNIKSSARLKCADIRLDYQRRFDALLQARGELAKSPTPPTESQAQAYCQRYWNLQMDQFKDWKNGWLTERDMRSWLKIRYIEWSANEEIYPGLYYQQTWISVRSMFEAENFAEFFETLTLCEGAFETAIKGFRPPWYKRLHYWLFR